MFARELALSGSGHACGAAAVEGPPIAAEAGAGWFARELSAVLGARPSASSGAGPDHSGSFAPAAAAARSFRWKRVMISTALESSIIGTPLPRTDSSRTFSTSAPVRSAACTLRFWLWPP